MPLRALPFPKSSCERFLAQDSLGYLFFDSSLTTDSAITHLDKIVGRGKDEFGVGSDQHLMSYWLHEHMDTTGFIHTTVRPASKGPQSRFSYRNRAVRPSCILSSRVDCMKMLQKRTTQLKTSSNRTYFVRAYTALASATLLFWPPDKERALGFGSDPTH